MSCLWSYIPSNLILLYLLVFANTSENLSTAIIFYQMYQAKSVGELWIIGSDWIAHSPLALIALTADEHENIPEMCALQVYLAECQLTPSVRVHDIYKRQSDHQIATGAFDRWNTSAYSPPLKHNSGWVIENNTPKRKLTSPGRISVAPLLKLAWDPVPLKWNFDLLTKVMLWCYCLFSPSFLHWQFVVKKEQITYIIWILAFVFPTVDLLTRDALADLIAGNLSWLVVPLTPRTSTFTSAFPLAFDTDVI